MRVMGTFLYTYKLFLTKKSHVFNNYFLNSKLNS